MGFMIKSDVSEQFLREEDAVEGFRQAVDNGQVRLALQILVDIVDVFEGFIASFVEDDEEKAPKEQEAVETLVQTPVVEEKAEVVQAEEKVEEIVQEKKAPAKKTTAKEDEGTKAVAQ